MSDGTNLEVPGGESSSKTGGDGNGGDGKGTVAYETYKKTVDSEKALKKQLKDLSDKVALFEGTAKAEQERKQLENNQHLEVISDLKKQLGDANSKISENDSRWNEMRKTSAALGLLTQKGITLDSKYVHLIDLDDVSIDSSGNIDTGAVQKAVENFQKEHPALAQTKKSDLPGGKPGGTGKPLTHEEWAKLPYDQKKLRVKDIRP